MKLISACLLGIKCAWHGGHYISGNAIELLAKDILIPVCPEQLGGLNTPRAPQEIQSGTGEDVLDGRSRVINRNGDDVTNEFLRGAEETLKIAKLLGIKEFIAKSTSPSCGFGEIYDGSFSGRLIYGNGVTTALLRRNGITIITEQKLQSH